MSSPADSLFERLRAWTRIEWSTPSGIGACHYDMGREGARCEIIAILDKYEAHPASAVATDDKLVKGLRKYASALCADHSYDHPDILMLRAAANELESKAVAPHPHKTRFDGELRFVEFASYEAHGPTIMVYTKEAWERSERGDNPGPIGFIPVSKLPKHAPHRITREQAEKIARAGWSAIEYAGEDLRGPEYAKGYDAALTAAGITVEEQPHA